MAKNTSNNSEQKELSSKIVPLHTPKVPVAPEQPKLSKAHRERKLKDQVTLLNDIVCIRLAPSQINGVGVFAMRDMKKGQKIYSDVIPHQFDLPFIHFKKLGKEIRDILLGHFPLIVSGSHFLYPVTKFSAYLNHSDNPNYDAVNDKLLRDVVKGEEITEDYKLIKNHLKIFPFLSE